MKLFPHEKIKFHDNHEKDPRLLSEDESNRKYVKGEVRIVTEQARYPLPSIVGMIKSGKYELNPEFQRRHRWYNDKKSQLIESFIMNVPIPPIFLYEDSYAHYEVMDGLQRLTTIYEFYTNQLELEGLQEWPELNGCKYSELPEQIKYGIDRRYLSSIILLYETSKNEAEAKKLKRLVFKRINSGGVELTPQESRHALYNGPLNQLCHQLSRDRYLCRLWDIPEPKAEETNQPPRKRLRENYIYRRMEDVELVLRFFAYRQRLNHPWNSLKDYLDDFLNHGNRLPPEVLKQYEGLFKQTIELVYQTFGERAFHPRRQTKNGKWVWHRHPAKAVYDPLMYVFSQHMEKSEEIRQHRRQFKDGLKKLYGGAENREILQWKKRRTAEDMQAMNALFEKLVTDTIGSKL